MARKAPGKELYKSRNLFEFFTVKYCCLESWTFCPKTSRVPKPQQPSHAKMVEFHWCRKINFSWFVSFCIYIAAKKKKKDKNIIGTRQNCNGETWHSLLHYIANNSNPSPYITSIKNLASTTVELARWNRLIWLTRQLFFDWPQLNSNPNSTVSPLNRGAAERR